MGLIRASIDAFSGTLADQWKEIIEPPSFDERTLVVPGVLKKIVNGRGSNVLGGAGMHGSRIGELDDQIEAIRKLKALLDEGILSQDEFDIKKKEIMGL